MNLRLLSAALVAGLAFPGFLSTQLPAQWAGAATPAQPTGDASVATARRELLERLDRVQGRGPKYELTASLVRTSKAAGKLRTIPFKAGSDGIPVAEGQSLLDAMQDAKIQAMLRGPGAILIVLGYPDAGADHGGGMPPLAARRAAAMEKFLVKVVEVKATTASFGAGPSASGVPGGGVEIWVIFP